MEPGQYTDPLDRVNPLMLPLVNGYTTGRLFVSNAYYGTVQGTWQGSLPYYNVTCTVQNLTSTAATMQLVEKPSAVSGPRSNLAAAVPLAGNGFKVFDFNPTASFVEIKCTSGGPTNVRIQFDSKLTWTLQGFTKYPVPDPLYPQYTISAPYAVLSWP